MIDKYKKGILSEQEMDQTEEKLLKKMFDRKADEEVRQNLRFQLEVLNTSSETSEDTSTLTPDADAPGSALRVVHRNKWMTWAAAASVLLVLGAAWWFFGRSTVEDLAAEAFAANYLKTEVAPSLSNVMDDSQVTATEQAARDAYLQGDFVKAARGFAGIPPATAAQLFYLGIAYLKQAKPNYSSAVNGLLQARKLGNGWQEDAINWHLALAYLGQKRNTEAQQELENIISVGRDNVAKAQLLLEKMK